MKTIDEHETQLMRSFYWAVVAVVLAVSCAVLYIVKF